MIICGIFVCVDGTRITDPEQVFYSWVVCVHGWFVFMGGFCSYVHCPAETRKTNNVSNTGNSYSNEPTIQ